MNRILQTIFAFMHIILMHPLQADMAIDDANVNEGQTKKALTDKQKLKALEEEMFTNMRLKVYQECLTQMETSIAYTNTYGNRAVPFGPAHREAINDYCRCISEEGMDDAFALVEEGKSIEDTMDSFAESLPGVVEQCQKHLSIYGRTENL